MLLKLNLFLILHPVFTKHNTISQTIMHFDKIIKLFCNYTTQRTLLIRTSLYLVTPTRQNIFFQILCIFLSALFNELLCPVSAMHRVTTARNV
jgi:hypothetical protein